VQRRAAAIRKQTMKRRAAQPSDSQKKAKAKQPMSAGCGVDGPVAGRSLASRLVALVPELDLSVRVAFGHLGLQKDGIIFAWLDATRVGVRPATDAQRVVLQELECVRQPAEGFHKKNPYWDVPAAVLNDAARWSRLVKTLVSEEQIKAAATKRAARKSRVRTKAT